MQGRTEVFSFKGLLDVVRQMLFAKHSAFPTHVLLHHGALSPADNPMAWGRWGLPPAAQHIFRAGSDSPQLFSGDCSHTAPVFKHAAGSAPHSQHEECCHTVQFRVMTLMLPLLPLPGGVEGII